MTENTVTILYLHGLNSSPTSLKASLLVRAIAQMGLADRLRVPALHHHPRQAIAQLERLILELDRPLLVGSSLGGYYATHLAERHGLRALLINPAVRAGVAVLPTGSWYAPVDHSAKAMDLSGNPNVLTLDKGSSRFSQGCSAHTCLITIEPFGEPELSPA